MAKLVLSKNIKGAFSPQKRRNHQIIVAYFPSSLKVPGITQQSVTLDSNSHHRLVTFSVYQLSVHLTKHQ